MGKEKLTFLPYSDGILPERLRIGHLCADVYNPATGNEDERFGFNRKEYPTCVYLLLTFSARQC